MLTLYFSGTGNTKYIAKLFSKKMGARCLSIEDEADFSEEIKKHKTIVFCYPIYGSRVPWIMRRFAHYHLEELSGKKVVILVTQMLFSGDGARAFTDIFEEGATRFIYAEHFFMPNNINNVPLLKKPSKRLVRHYIRRARAKMERVCSDINNGVVRLRGFTRPSQAIGSVQGRFWPRMEAKAQKDVKTSSDCDGCGVCAAVCPMENLEMVGDKVHQKGDCTVCYRCVNKCPERAITVLLHKKPGWQYDFSSFRSS